jgi:hypothetical protein
MAEHPDSPQRCPGNHRIKHQYKSPTIIRRAFLLDRKYCDQQWVQAEMTLHPVPVI